MESKRAAIFVINTGGEVVAKIAGSFSAVHLERGADGVVHISTGISHHTGAWHTINLLSFSSTREFFLEKQTNKIKNRINTLPVETATPR